MAGGYSAYRTEWAASVGALGEASGSARCGVRAETSVYAGGVGREHPAFRADIYSGARRDWPALRLSAFVPPLPGGLLSLLVQRNVTKESTPPGWRPAARGHLRFSRARGTAPTRHPCLDGAGPTSCRPSPARAAMLSAIQGDPGESKSKTIFACASSFAFDSPPLESAEHRSPRRPGSRSEARQEPKPFRRARDGASESPTRARSTGHPRSGRSMGCVSFGYIFLAHTKKSNPPGRGGTKTFSKHRQVSLRACKSFSTDSCTGRTPRGYVAHRPQASTPVGFARLNR
ncbi:MAG: hypothetical protein JWR16_617 [Nevskia sp.]|nr:hypothetical protein [Nevskia sp.]